ncbi:MAG: hypothetical protein ACXVAY_18770 [Mucilaginibacter sp.]
MLARNYKVWVCMLFIAVFAIKTSVCVIPALLSISNKEIKNALTQLELDNKTEKDSSEKDNTSKDFLKKVCDDFNEHIPVFTALLIESNILHNRERSLYVELYHPVVPTPPPNA